MNQFASPGQGPGLFSRAPDEPEEEEYEHLNTGYRTTVLHRELRSFALHRQVRLVVIDSLHDVFAGNENFRPEDRAFVQAMANIAVAINGAVAVLAHPSQNGLDRGSGTSGSRPPGTTPCAPLIDVFEPGDVVRGATGSGSQGLTFTRLRRPH
jgi:hypothetical protein